MGFIEPTLKKKQQYWKVKQGESKKAQLFFFGDSDISNQNHKAK
jgi:hypothetical protein